MHNCAWLTQVSEDVIIWAENKHIRIKACFVIDNFSLLTEESWDQHKAFWSLWAMFVPAESMQLLCEAMFVGQGVSLMRLRGCGVRVLWSGKHLVSSLWSSHILQGELWGRLLLLSSPTLHRRRGRKKTVYFGSVRLYQTLGFQRVGP